MENENNFVKGVNGQYNFYVTGFDTENHYVNYGQEYFDLSLTQAQEIFKKSVKDNPTHINTILGVAYVTDKQELDIYGTGTVDLLQCIDGKIGLCEDYKQSPLLSSEGFIAVNTVNILSRQLNELQEILNIKNKSKLLQNEPNEKGNGKGSIRSAIRDIRNNLSSFNNQINTKNQQVL